MPALMSAHVFDNKLMARTAARRLCGFMLLLTAWTVGGAPAHALPAITCSSAELEIVRTQSRTNDNPYHISINETNLTCTATAGNARSPSANTISIGSNSNDNGDFAIQFGTGFTDVTFRGVARSNTFVTDLSSDTHPVTYAFNGSPRSFTFGITQVSDSTDQSFAESGGTPVAFTIDGPPIATAISRKTPTSQTTDADVLVFRVEFDEAVQNVSADDFSAIGTTATATNIQQLSASLYDVTISGGDLAGLNGTVSLGFAGLQNIQDANGNAFAGGSPSGVNNQSYTLDNTPPSVGSITRQAPTDESTNSDTLLFRVIFSEGVSNVDTSDFAPTGTTAAATNVLQVNAATYDVTVSGGDLANLQGTVGLGFVPGQNVTSTGGTSLVSTTPTGADETFNVDNTAPTIAIASTSTDPVSGAFSITVTFSEDVTGFEASDLTIGNGAASDFAATSASVYTATITPSGDGAVTVDIAADAAQDSASNGNTAAPQFSITSDNTVPSVAIASTSSDPVSGAFSITVTFSEDVTGFEVSDLTVGNGAASDFAATSASVYTATITPSGEGAVTVDVAADAAQDSASNGNTAAPQFSITSDNTVPSVAIASTSSDPVSGAFSITVTFSEDVTGFEASDLTVANGAASDFVATSASLYTATITPSGDGAVTVDVAADAAQDRASNGNTAAETFTIGVDKTAPGLLIELPGDEATGAFIATFTFTEPVSGFELADIGVANGAASELTGSGAVYTATITPQLPGDVVISVAAGSAGDLAGNETEQANASIKAVSNTPDVEVALSAETASPGDVAATATISNPGSEALPFTASADVSWLSVSPSSGTISPLGSFDLEISLNDGVDALQPGDYVGTITVTAGEAGVALASIGGSVGSQPVQSAGAGNAPIAQLPQGTVLVELPVSVTIEERFGTLQLVARTPSGVSGDETFTYTSSVAAFDGLSLSTRGGSASVSSGSLLFGSYTLTQFAPAGWRVESFSCAGDTDGGTSFDVASATAVIDVDPGENLVCTYRNVRDEDAVRLATQRAIRGFMVRRADRIIGAAPDLSRRLSERQTTARGGMAANVSGDGRYNMSFNASLAGARNAAAAADANDRARFNNTDAPFLDGWDVWVAAEVSGITDNRAGERAESDFGVVQLGLDYEVSPDLLIGGLAQYDWMDETAREVFTNAGAIASATTEGEGWMAGPYAVWRLRDTLLLDGLVMYGQSDNLVNPLGLYEDGFDTDRFLIRAGLTGELVSGSWRLRPQANLTHYEESQDAYTDSLGIDIPGQDISLGRLRAGPELVWRHDTVDRGWVELSATLNAVWDYDAAELLSEAGQLVGEAHDLRADARLGLTAQTPWGPLLRVEIGLAGLGVGDFEARTGRLELRIPFGSGNIAQGAAALSTAGLASDCSGLRQDMEATPRGSPSAPGCGAPYW